MNTSRNYSFIDQLIGQADQVLRTLASQSTVSHRPSPADAYSEVDMDDSTRRHIAGLMRINHTGEVCAQALYQGQALTAKLETVRDKMEAAAREEEDHLAWCQQRLNDLDSHTSVLNPAFYLASFTIGAIAGVAGDHWSLGFVAETEKQVCRHLDSHLEKLPAEEQRSRAVLSQMRMDEEEHATHAIVAGGRELPLPVRKAMTLMSRVMTKTTYHI